jgi:hypothetical protein
MTEPDPTRERWEREYPGVTDTGEKLPISQVTPGCFVHSIPFGYMPLREGEDVEAPWQWKWMSISPIVQP